MIHVKSMDLGFFAPTRTGSSWMAQVLKEEFGGRRGLGNQHCTNCDSTIWPGTCITIIRNPFDWLRSVFRHARRGDHWVQLQYSACVLNGLVSRTFDEFIRKVAARPRIVEYVFAPHLDFADVVFRTETLRTQAEKYFGRKLILPPRSVSNGTAAAEWTDDLRDMILESEHKFLDMYFPGSLVGERIRE